MAESEEDIQPTETDIFQQQKKTIDTLIDVLEKDQGGSAPQQIYYSQAASPQQKPPNYIMWIGIGIAVFLLLRKKR